MTNSLWCLGASKLRRNQAAGLLVLHLILNTNRFRHGEECAGTKKKYRVLRVHRDILLKMLPWLKASKVRTCFRMSKNLSVRILQCTLKKNMLYRLLTSPKIRTFLSPTLISMPNQLLKSPWVPEQNLKINWERFLFTYF